MSYLLFDISYHSGDGNDVTLTLLRFQTYIIPTSGMNPSAAGQPVTITAQLSPSPPAQTTPPTGTVTFYDGATVLGPAPLVPSPNSNFPYSASLTTVFTTPGSHLISVSYSGDSFNAPSVSGQLNQTVNSSLLITDLLSNAPAAPALSAATRTQDQSSASVQTEAPVLSSPGAVLGRGTPSDPLLSHSDPTWAHLLAAQETSAGKEDLDTIFADQALPGTSSLELTFSI